MVEGFPYLFYLYYCLAALVLIISFRLLSNYFIKLYISYYDKYINMRDTLRHRGPDDAGLFVDGPIGLGHRRWPWIRP